MDRCGARDNMMTTILGTAIEIVVLAGDYMHSPPGIEVLPAGQGVHAPPAE